MLKLPHNTLLSSKRLSELGSSLCSVTWMNMERWDDVKKKKICPLSIHLLKFSFHALLKNNNLSKILSSISASDAETQQNQLELRLCWFWNVSSIQESKLTYDTQFCAGKNDAVSVFRYTLIHARV